MSTISEKLVGLATPSYLAEQFSSLSQTIYNNLRTLINECSVTSNIEFEEGTTDPIFHPTLGEKVHLGSIALEGNNINVYDDEGEYIDDLAYIDYDSQLSIYRAVYDQIKNSDND